MLKNTYSIRRIEYTPAVREYIRVKHYTGSSPLLAQYAFGLYEFGGIDLLGICIFSNQSRYESVKKHPHHLELSRLFIVDGTPKNTESFFIGFCLRWLRDNDETVIGVVTYADPTVGHLGTIYKASNFNFVGYTASSHHYIDALNNWIHKRAIGRKAVKAGKSEKEYALAEGLKKIPEKPKLKFKFTLQKDVPAYYGEIYKITNGVNGKVYIGQTVRGIKARFRDHKYEANYPLAPLHKAMAKYGSSNFNIEVIDTALYEEDLKQKEAFHIETYDSLHPKGYNIADPYSGESFRIPDEVLYRSFELRQSGKRIRDIADIIGVNISLISDVHRGASRPHLRRQWVEKNGDFYAKLREESCTRRDDICHRYFIREDTTETIASKLGLAVEVVERVIFGETVGDKFQIFKMRYQDNLAATAIAEQLHTSVTYITKVLTGEISPSIKKTWDTKFGSTEHRQKNYLTKSQLHEIFEGIYLHKLTITELASKYLISTGRLRRVIYARTFVEEQQQWLIKHPNVMPYNSQRKYSDQTLRECFLMRSKSMLVKTIAAKFYMNSAWLNCVFTGFYRAYLLKDWLSSGGFVLTQETLGTRNINRIKPEEDLLQCFQDRVDGLTLDELVKKYSYNKSWLSDVFNGKTRPEVLEKWKVNGGCDFKQLAKRNSAEGASKKCGKPVIAEGREFPSAMEAAKHYNMSDGGIRKSIKTGKPCKGITFIYG